MLVVAEASPQRGGHAQPQPNLNERDTMRHTERPVGRYTVSCKQQLPAGSCEAIVWRQAAGGARAVRITSARGRTAAAAVREARRNVRNARKAGGL